MLEEAHSPILWKTDLLEPDFPDSASFFALSCYI